MTDKLQIIREFDSHGRRVAEMFALHANAIALFNAASKPITFDAYFYRDNDLVAIAEVKTRKAPYDLAYIRAHGDLLFFDKEKLESVYQWSQQLQVPAMLLTRLADDTCWCHSMADPAFTYTDAPRDVSKNQFSSDRTVKAIAAVPMAVGKNFAYPADADDQLRALLAHYPKFPTIKSKEQTNGEKH